MVTYGSLLADPDFQNSLGNTLCMVVFDVPVHTLLSFLVALALNQRMRDLAFFRTVFMLPIVATAIIGPVDAGPEQLRSGAYPHPRPTLPRQH